MKTTHDESNSTGSDLVDKFASNLRRAQTKQFDQEFQKAKDIQVKKEYYQKEFGASPQGINYALDDQMEKLCCMKSHLVNE